VVEGIERSMQLKITHMECGDISDIIVKLSNISDVSTFSNYKCTHDGKKDCIENVCITVWPEILVVNILLHYNLKTYKKLKKSGINSASITGDVKVGGNVYKVFGICFHIGDYANSGHYISFVRNWEQQGWYLCNDKFVVMATVADIVNQFSVAGSDCYSVWYHRRRNEVVV
jgi:uncharacterized UBP type Zn finger protein